MNVATDKAPTLQTKWVYISQFCYLSYCSNGKKHKETEREREANGKWQLERAKAKAKNEINRCPSSFFIILLTLLSPIACKSLLKFIENICYRLYLHTFVIRLAQ